MEKQGLCPTATMCVHTVYDIYIFTKKLFCFLIICWGLFCDND